MRLDQAREFDLKKLKKVQRQAVKNGAVTLSFLTSREYLAATKRELSCNRINLRERLKELAWENKCLDKEWELYSTFQWQYANYALHYIKQLADKLPRAWQQEQSVHTIKPKGESVQELLRECEKELQELIQAQTTQLDRYDAMWKPERILEAWANCSGYSHQRPLLPIGSPLAQKPIGTEMDLYTRIENFVREKSWKLWAMTYMYEFIPRANGRLLTIGQLLSCIRTAHYCAIAGHGDRSEFNRLSHELSNLVEAINEEILKVETDAYGCHYSRLDTSGTSDGHGGSLYKILNSS